MNSKIIRACVCQLCSENIFETDCLDHIKICVLNSKNNQKINVFSQKHRLIYEQYFILSFILNIIEEFDYSLHIKFHIIYNFIFEIYVFLYFKNINRSYESALLGVDDFARLCLSKINNFKDKYINIIPGLSLFDFVDNEYIYDLNIIFSRSQIFNLKNGEYGTSKIGYEMGYSAERKI